MFKKGKASRRCARTKYAKIPLKTKVRFLQRVILDGMSIKNVTVPLTQSASRHQLNYTTAKTLMQQYEAHRLDCDLSLVREELSPPSLAHQPHLCCGYKVLPEQNKLTCDTLTTACPAYEFPSLDSRAETGESESHLPRF